MKTKARVRKILHQVHNAPRKGRVLLAKVNRKATHITKDVDHYITKNPYQTMGATLLAGVCIGFLINR